MNLGAILLVCAALAVDRPEIIAHRGESADAPENTLAAFNLAWERKVKAVELDVHLTKDGRLAVIHDADTKRTAGTSRLVRESNWSELKDLDVGRWKNEKFAGEKMATLEDALATIPAGARCFIEVKVGPESVPALVKAIESCGKSPEQLVVISFYADTVAETKKRLPHIKAYYLSGFKKDKATGEVSPSVEELIKKAKELGADGLDVAFSGPIDEAFVRRVKDAKLELYVWTVNDAAVARRLAKLGVDGITTDKAAWLRDELRK
jgi:glycerophosphoryl diester phosphodiesterase